MNDRVSVVFKDPHILLPEYSEAHKGLPPPKKYVAMVFDAQDGKAHLGGDFVRAKIRRIIGEFAEYASDKIFLYEIEVASEIVIDVKYPRVALDAHQHRPLEVLHQRGHIVTMLCRPDPKREMGMIFKFCPEHSIIGEREFEDVVIGFNEQFEPREPLGVGRKFHPLDAEQSAVQVPA